MQNVMQNVPLLFFGSFGLEINKRLYTEDEVCILIYNSFENSFSFILIFTLIVNQIMNK